MKATHAVFDTESTGLFLFKDEATGAPVPADDPRQPRLASFAMIYLDADGAELRRTHKLIKPDGWVMSGEALAVNGLTMERLHDEGVPVAEVLDEYTEVIRARADLVAYNAQHDCKQMRAELRRAGRDDLFMITRNICLMRASHSAGVIKPDNGRGFPKLEHACAYMGITRAGAHTSIGDALDAVEVFRWLKGRDLLPPAVVHFAKNHPGNAAAAAPKAKRAKKAPPAGAMDEIPT